MEKFYTYFNSALEFLFPRTISEALVERITVEELLSKANTQLSVNDNGTFILFHYHDPTIKKLIWAFKYQGKTKVARLFADVLYVHLPEKLSDDALFLNFTHPIIIPVPLSKKRRRERGFNQTELIAEQLKQKDKANFFDIQGDVLIRVRETEHQAHLQNKSKRQENLKGAFAVKNTHKIKNRNIILLDDVITSGSTIGEAKKVLTAAGVKQILVVTIAG